jgi:hypothetical protein
VKATAIAKTSLKPGHKTVLGIVTDTKLSPSGKTITITVRNERDGHLFTDRVSALGNMYVFTDEISEPPIWVRMCDHHGCVITAPHAHGA